MCLGRRCRGLPVHVSRVGGCPHICPWVGSHAPSFGRQLWGLPSRVEYLSPQGVLLPLVYGTTASPLWLELRGHSAWQATPSWTVYRLACHRLLPWLRVTFVMVPDAAWPGSNQLPWSTAAAPGPVGRPGRPSASNPWGVGSFLSLGRPTCVRCPGPLASCSLVCPCGMLCCVCGVLGHLAPVHWCAGLGVLCCVCGVLNPLAPVHRCARWLCCVVCAVSRATWLLFTDAPAPCVALRVRCCGPLGCCSPMCLLCPLFCLCGVLGHLAPVHRCARSVCCFVCAVSWASWLLFTGVPGCGDPSLGALGACACAVCWPTWRLITGVRPVCSARVPLVVVSLFLPPYFSFFFASSVFVFFEMEKRRPAYTAGTGTGNWCSGAIVLYSLACVVGALVAVAPHGCGSRVLMYMGMGQGGFR